MDGEYACGLLILSMSMSISLYRNWYLRMGSTPRTYILIVSISISMSMSYIEVRYIRVGSTPITYFY